MHFSSLVLSVLPRSASVTSARRSSPIQALVAARRPAVWVRGSAPRRAVVCILAGEEQIRLGGGRRCASGAHFVRNRGLPRTAAAAAQVSHGGSRSRRVPTVAVHRSCESPLRLADGQRLAAVVRGFPDDVLRYERATDHWASTIPISFPVLSKRPATTLAHTWRAAKSSAQPAILPSRRSLHNNLHADLCCPTSRMMLPTVAILALALQVQAAEYTLYHRFLDGSDFAPRGVVQIDNSRVTYEPSSEPSSSDADWYQVALDVGDQQLTTSTRAVSLFCWTVSDGSASLRRRPR